MINYYIVIDQKLDGLESLVNVAILSDYLPNGTVFITISGAYAQSMIKKSLLS